MLKRPTTHQRVMDVVAQSGIDVSDWSNYSGPPASNPKYCYSWCFEKPGDFVLLNLWYDEAQEKDGQVFQAINYRELANTLDSNKKATWGKRARQVDSMLQKAWRDSLAVRVAICDGSRREIDTPDSDPSKVERRYLDTDTWAVTSYDWNTGACVVTRGISPERYIDQHALPDADTEDNTAPKVAQRLVDVWERSAAVRRRALVRAGGSCEWCGKAGFVTTSGAIYLETHHIVPLSEGGPDTAANVIALCPNDHREAHFSVTAAGLRAAFIAKITKPS